MATTYDKQCRVIAEAFLMDRYLSIGAVQYQDQVRDLASTIQAAIDGWISTHPPDATVPGVVERIERQIQRNKIGGW